MKIVGPDNTITQGDIHLNRAGPKAELLGAAILNACSLEEPFEPERLIDAFKCSPELEGLYSELAVREGYSVGEHSLMVLREFEKYYQDKQLPSELSRTAWRIAFALHDIGKSLPDKTADQHIYTLDVMDKYREYLPVTDREFEIMKAIISDDCMGSFFYRSGKNTPNGDYKLHFAWKQANGALAPDEYRDFIYNVHLCDEESFGVVLTETANKISETAAGVNLSASEFLTLKSIYYQLDVSAYSIDAEREIGMSRPDWEPRGGLASDKGGKFSRGYRELETYIADGAEKGRETLTRGYVSLDFILAVDSEFAEFSEKAGEQKLFLFNEEGGRIGYCSAYEKAYESLLEECQRRDSLS